MKRRGAPLNKGEALDEAAKETLTAQPDFAIARVTDERLRVQIAQFRAAADRAPRASALESSAATGDPIGVLAALLGRADKRAGVLAAYADASRIGGKLCERTIGRARTAGTRMLVWPNNWAEPWCERS